MTKHSLPHDSNAVIFPGEVFASITDFDTGIRQLLPKYDEMLETIARSLPSHTASILELGCGTGELSLKVLQRFPEANVTALDYSPRMLEFARQKVDAAGYGQRWRGIQADFGDWANNAVSEDIGTGFEGCISSLAIHHLSDEMKLQLFTHIYSCLHSGGAFWNADPILPEIPQLSEVYKEVREDWARKQGTTLAEVRGKIGKSQAYGYSDSDRLATLEDHLQMLQTAGFDGVAVLWKYYGLAVFGGVKLD